MDPNPNPKSVVVADRAESESPAIHHVCNCDTCKSIVSKLGVVPSEEIKSGDAVDPPMPSSSPVPEIKIEPQPDSRHEITRADNEEKLKRNRNGKDRKEVVRYLHKNLPSSRCMQLMAAMASPLPKKRRFKQR